MYVLDTLQEPTTKSLSSFDISDPFTQEYVNFILNVQSPTQLQEQEVDQATDTEFQPKDEDFKYPGEDDDEFLFEQIPGFKYLPDIYQICIIYINHCIKKYNWYYQIIIIYFYE